MAAPVLGLRANAGQFVLLVGLNALVGAMVGLERSVLPLVGSDEFGIESTTSILAFVVAFGAAKSLANLVSGELAERLGRKRLLVLGWLIALPVPVLIGLAAVVVVRGRREPPPRRQPGLRVVDDRGDEDRPRGSRPPRARAWAERGGGVSRSRSRRIRHRSARRELRAAHDRLGRGGGDRPDGPRRQRSRGPGHGGPRCPRAGRPRGGAHTGLRGAFAYATLRDPVLRACNQAGLVNNLNDALAWGLVPLYLAARGASVREIAIVAAAYPVVWGAGQLLTGWLSDHIGRKQLIVGGMLLQAAALALLVAGGGAFAPSLAAALILGAGTAMVYPTLIAAVSDATQPAIARGSSACTDSGATSASSPARSSRGSPRTQLPPGRQS
jgi:hypothetical protein